MDPGNVERPAVETQVRRMASGVVLTQVRWRPLGVDQVRRLAT
jgi:hypothetical protein